VSSHIGNSILYCCLDHSFLSEFPSSSWIMDIRNVMEVNKFYYLRIWEKRIVNILISSTKIKPCSLGIIYNALLFVAQGKSFCFLSYPRPAYFRKHPVRFSLFGSCGLERQFLILFALIFTAARGRAGTRRGACGIGARPHRTRHCGRPVPYRVHQKANVATSASGYRIGTSAIRLNEELAAISCWMSN
jgi:hypothetical protein